MRLKGRGARIEAVLPGSPAEREGLEAGDRIIAINHQPVRDMVDYLHLSAGDWMAVSVLKDNGTTAVLQLKRNSSENWGIRFATWSFDGMKSCSNRCIFCFIDQLPPGMRSSLYEKDDDYRWSFFQGNFVTLTNTSGRELDRIIELRISPLYISVHSTDPELRKKMLNNPRAGIIMEQLRKLAAGGIKLHLQVVLCPGINDGENLNRTIQDLYQLGRNVASIGLVPIGLTRYRRNLTPLQGYTAEQAGVLIEQVESWQSFFLQEIGRRLVFLADEFYLLAGVEFPPAEHYEGFPQLENGVGLARRFLMDFERIKPQLPRRIESPRRVLAVTGELGRPVLQPAVDELNSIEGLRVELLAVKNRFFGGGVGVTGLLCGIDLIESLKDKEPAYDRVIVPQVILRHETDQLLDGYKLEDVRKATGHNIMAVPTSARGLVEAALGHIPRKVGKKSLRRALRGIPG